MKLKSCQNQTQLTNSTRRNSIVVGGHFCISVYIVCLLVCVVCLCVRVGCLCVCVAIVNISAIEMKQSKTQIGGDLVQMQEATRKNATFGNAKVLYPYL